MLAIVGALEKWRHFVEGAEHHCEIWTDHKNLQYFMTDKQLNQRQARWSLLLVLSSEFRWRHRVRSCARRWLQLVGCAALLMDALNFGGLDGVGESGVEPRRSLRRQERVKEKSVAKLIFELAKYIQQTGVFIQRKT